MEKIPTILIGSGIFAVNIFKSALELDYLDIKYIVTQPDKPFGRDKALRGSDVYESLKDIKGIEWLKPEKMSLEYSEILKKANPGLILVASYGQILPKEFIDYPKYRSLNFHGSILPDLRGAVPVHMAILNGLKVTGVTLQTMSEGLDEGDIVSVREVDIDNSDTTDSLMMKLSKLSVDILNEDLIKYIKKEITPVPQNGEATYCYRTDIAKEKAEIRFTTDINLSERMIRAFYPWPIAFVKISLNNELKILKIFKSQIHSNTSNNKFGLIRDGKKLILNLSNGSLELLEVQLEGKIRDSAINYLYLAK